MFVLALGLAGAVFATGCNTVHGAGEDIEAGGEAIQRAAK
ncbi:entericidin EcnA/B family protein [Oligella urethralis]|nr:entericidin EcnA/B family protein [Oligella urethralis]